MKTRSRNQLDLTTGSVTGKLLAFTMPVLASNLLQHLYNAADKAVVGKFAVNGSLALAATGATGSAITLLLNLFVGLATGANVVCANLRGASKPNELRRAMHTSITLAALAGVCAMVIGLLAAEPFLQLMACPDELIDLATLYMRIYFVGAPFSLLYNFGSAILRAHGDTKRPMIILAVSGLANVALNLVFVICFGMDVDGVAWATVISQILSAVIVLWILFKPDGGFDLNLRELKLHGQELASIVRIGIPCGLNGIVFSISNVTVQSAINTLGADVMAGCSASGGITGLVFQVLASFSIGCVSFSGQCFGARLYDRIDRLEITSISLCCAMMAALSMIVTFFPRPFLLIFTNNEAAIREGTPQMVITCWSYLLYSMSELTLGTLRGMRYSTVPTLLNVGCICLPRLIWVFFFFPMLPQLWFLYLCYPISYAISATAQILYFLRVRKTIRVDST